jgi:hypothetical protein
MISFIFAFAFHRAKQRNNKNPRSMQKELLSNFMNAADNSFFQIFLAAKDGETAFGSDGSTDNCVVINHNLGNRIIGADGLTIPKSACEFDNTKHNLRITISQEFVDQVRRIRTPPQIDLNGLFAELPFTPRPGKDLYRDAIVFVETLHGKHWMTDTNGHRARFRR